MHKSTFKAPSLLLGLSFALMAMLSSCSTYHEVAVWYKYRKDFHLPKEQTAVARNTMPQAAPAEAGSAVATAPSSIAAENAQSAQPERMAKMSRKEIRREVRKAMRESKRGNLPVMDPQATASAAPGQIQVDTKPVWERALAQPEAPKKPAGEGSFSIAAIIGFVLAALGFLGALAFSSPILFIATVVVALVLSIIGIMQTGPNGAHRGLGFAIAGLILSGLIILAILLNND
jgi:hypothetical protein